MKRSQRTAATTASSIQGSFGKAQGAIKAGVAGFLGGLSVSLILNAGKAALDYAGSLGEVAQQLGVTTRELQTFRYAAQQNGATLEEADGALGKFAIAMSKALSGSKQAAAAFNAVGVSLQDLQSKSRAEVLGQIADRMKDTGGAAANAAAGVAIFGRGFLKIVPTLDQGSAGMNALAQAADELGIVLSDEQIAKADETADKLDALKTVLSAKIAGVVADNADSILGLANALAEVARRAGNAIQWLGALRPALAKTEAQARNLNPFLSPEEKFANRMKIARATLEINNAASGVPIRPIGRGGVQPRPTGAPSRFLGGGSGGGGRSRRSGADDAERKRQEAMRDAFRFDQELRRADMDIVRAKQQLATDYTERAALSIELLNLEKAAYQAELAYEVKSGERTQAQADALMALRNQKDALERQSVLADEETKRKEDYAKLEEVDYDLKRDALEKQASLAETASERRAIELRILDLAYQEERARLTRITQESKDWAEIEEARRRLLELSKNQSLDRQGVKQQTRGPLEDYFASLPTDAAKMNEALESIAAEGLQNLEDGIMDVITGTKSLKDAFHQMAAAILADLLRLAIQKYIIGTIMKVAGVGMADGGPVEGFASGGFVSGPGGPREDRVPALLSDGEYVVNAKATKAFLPLLERINSGSVRLAMGGLAVPTMGQRVNTNDNEQTMRRGMSVTVNNDFRGADPSSVARIQAHLNDLEQRLPGQIVSTVQDAKQRFVLR